MATTYLGEAAGPRVFLQGQGLTQVGSGYQLDLETWDITPAGAVGTCSFRSVDVTFLASNGYSIGVTPIVDGVAQLEQLFSGVGAGEVKCQAFIALRGARIAARVRSLALTGDLDVHDVSCEYVVLRAAP